ncbi:MAG: 50S ribosomal protein L32 [Desulfobacterales bacterium]|jgi:large subunit ribosomal protein L32
MAVPKRKKSKSKRNKRRSHQKIAVPNINHCLQCGDAILSHHACTNCGTYKGRAVIGTE